MKKNNERSNERKVKFIGIDDWGRKVYQNINNKSIYKDIDCINFSGQYYTSDSFDGEPDCPLREDLKIFIVNNVLRIKNDSDWNLMISDPERLLTEEIITELKKHNDTIFHNNLNGELWIFDFKLNDVWFEATKINAVKRTMNLIAWK